MFMQASAAKSVAQLCLIIKFIFSQKRNVLLQNLEDIQKYAYFY